MSLPRAQVEQWHADAAGCTGDILDMYDRISRLCAAVEEAREIITGLLDEHNAVRGGDSCPISVRARAWLAEPPEGTR